MIEIRPESDRDIPAVRLVNEAAFETPAEASLVDSLREHRHSRISLVAEQAGQIVGHILFSPVTLEGSPDLAIAGLAPMAVLPDHQRRGIGSALVEAGLAQCRAAGFVAVVVLGHPEFYRRIGFVPASRFVLRCEYEVPDEAFMAIELQPGVLQDREGLIRYAAAFGNL